ncbi:MAG: putative urea ABC transporter substrate-binding protein [Ectothiorhodospiraceae bacterium]|jgi:NitT/TauT family transport system substrate-binding protein|nr:putative urea ABC transporter substrate-binding protein [Ectothiorhodospiraceae bacterium]
MRKTIQLILLALLLAGIAAGGSAFAQEKKKFKLAWSIYVGWMPWDYADHSGIVKKWADKYGIEIEVVQINDYVESINQYTAGAFDACVMTNMDALTIPAAGGVDSTALIVGDYSNGNDAVVLKGGKTLKDVKGRNVNLVELSVSHYLLARALDSVGMSERDVKVVNTSDADIVAAFTTPQVNAVTLWNPQLAEVMAMPNAAKVFDSSRIPGEILDLTVANSDVLKANPAFGKALVGAWYETMAIMAADDAKGRAARAHMGEASGTDRAGYEAQLKATHMYYQPAEGVAFTRSEQLVQTMDHVRKFSFAHGLLGEGARSADAVGIAFPGGKMLGNARNLKLRFDDAWMQMAAEGKL